MCMLESSLAVLISQACLKAVWQSGIWPAPNQPGYPNSVTASIAILCIKYGIFYSTMYLHSIVGFFLTKFMF